MSEEIKFSNGTTVKLGAKGQPLQGMTPASLDELLKEWEAEAHKNFQIFQDEIYNKRILSLIAGFRHLQIELGDIAMSDCSDYVKKMADNALAETERIQWEAIAKSVPVEAMDLRDLREQTYEDGEKIEKLIAVVRKQRQIIKDCIEGYEGHFGPDFWDSELGKHLKPDLTDAERILKG